MDISISTSSSIVKISREYKDSLFLKRLASMVATGTSSLRDIKSASSWKISFGEPSWQLHLDSSIRPYQLGSFFFHKNVWY